MKKLTLLKVLIGTAALVVTLQSAAFGCGAKAIRNVEATSIDEQMFITACEYRKDCRQAKDEWVNVQAFVVLPRIDTENILIIDEKGRCFFAMDFEIDHECAGELPVRVNEGCRND